LEYQRLEESYRTLERIRDDLQENENLHQSNLTDAQKELESSQSHVSLKAFYFTGRVLPRTVYIV